MARELDNMADIYKGALLTIVAASARDCAEGLFSPRHDVLIFEFPLHIGASHDEVKWLALEPRDTYNVEDEAISKRAWCMQERYFSRRVLIFGSRQLVRQCPGSDGSDGGVIWLARNRTPITEDELWTTRRGQVSMIDPSQAVDHWSDLVQAFSKRALTDPQDKLSALSGIARSLSYMIQAEYLAGLWKWTLPFGLTWWLKWSDRQPLPAKYRAPSWSWASVDGEINMPSLQFIDSQRPSACEVLETFVSVATPLAPFARVADAYLRVLGPMQEVHWLSNQSECDSRLIGIDGNAGPGDWVKLYRDSTELICEGELLALLLVMPFGQPEELSSQYDVNGELCGIILRPNEDGTTFRRIGSFSVAIHLQGGLRDSGVGGVIPHARGCHRVGCCTRADCYAQNLDYSTALCSMPGSVKLNPPLASADVGCIPRPINDMCWCLTALVAGYTQSYARNFQSYPIDFNSCGQAKCILRKHRSVHSHDRILGRR